MVRSKHTSAHTVVAMEIDYSAVELVRQAEKERFKQHEGVSLTYLPFIARAVIDAIADWPNINSSVGDDALVVHNHINLGVAVDLNLEGLLVPVIHDAGDKRLRALAREVASLAERARSKRLTMDDISGGTFTLTNAGPFGTLFTIPVINQPQVAILATDGIRKKPVVVELPDGTDAIAIHPVGNLVLSFDHRAIDGAYASVFMRDIKDSLETPGLVHGAMTLRIRWLGRVRYQDALALQRALFRGGPDADDWLLLLEHDHVYTMGVRARAEHVLVDPTTVGAELVKADRGGDVTYHGPGQLTGYPVRSVPIGPRATPDYVHGLEQLIIDVLSDLGLPGAGRLPEAPGVWVGDRKICAIGVRLSRGRSMHGFALNVDTDLSYFGHIVPCGITDKGVTSLAAEGIDVSMRQVVDAVAERAAQQWGEEDLPGCGDRRAAGCRLARPPRGSLRLHPGNRNSRTNARTAQRRRRRCRRHPCHR